MRKSIKSFTVSHFVNVILHFVHRFLINAITVPLFGYVAVSALNSMDSSDFGFVVDEKSLLFGLCFGLFLYAGFKFIFDTIFKPIFDYCNEFKKFKRMLGGRSNG